MGARGGEPFALSASCQGDRLDLVEGETLNLHIFYDRSVVEIFANEHLSLTSRVYPTRPDSVGVRLVSSGGPAFVKTLRAWAMKPIW